MGQYIHGLEKTITSHPTALTIGVFDGVHLGHHQLIRKLVAIAQDQHLQPAVLYFHPHPDVILRGRSGRFYLSAPDERASLLQELGVEIVISQPFDETIRQMSADDFVATLCNRLHLSTLVAGEGFALGHRRQGDVPYLSELGKKWGFEVHTLRLQEAGNVQVSSQTIRTALLNGSVEYVRDDLLGRAYSLHGKVVRGYQRGRTLGYPTANLLVWEEQLLPANGIYAGWATVRGERVMALTNLGKRPSFKENEITVESYLVDFDEDIYSEEITLSFEKFLRPEKQFAEIDDLKRQIASDVDLGVQYLRSQISEG